jgi:flagellar biosynthesis GTPase FlhF
VQYGRETTYIFRFGHQEIPLKICFPRKSDCKTRVTCGVHFDIDYSNENNQFKVLHLFSTLPSEEKEEEKTEKVEKAEKKENKEEKKVEEFPPLVEKKEEKKVEEFPPLVEKKEEKKEKKIISKNLYTDILKKDDGHKEGDDMDTDDKSKMELKMMVDYLKLQNTGLQKKISDLESKLYIKNLRPTTFVPENESYYPPIDPYINYDSNHEEYDDYYDDDEEWYTEEEEEEEERDEYGLIEN